MPEPHHPSRWSPEILEVIAPILLEWGYPVHDPFAGDGVRLGQLCDTLGLRFSGSEIEHPYIIDSRVQCEDSTYEASYPLGRNWCVVTSPVYPNGMTDHFKPRDGSRRITYRQSLAAITGEDRPLHVNNMGRYGPRQGKRKEAMYWQLAEQAVRWWPTRVVVNVSDCIHNHRVYPVVDRWRSILTGYGYRTSIGRVSTPRMRFGENGDRRVESEAVITAVWRQMV